MIESDVSHIIQCDCGCESEVSFFYCGSGLTSIYMSENYQRLSFFEKIRFSLWMIGRIMSGQKHYFSVVIVKKSDIENVIRGIEKFESRNFPFDTEIERIDGKY